MVEVARLGIVWLVDGRAMVSDGGAKRPEIEPDPPPRVAGLLTMSLSNRFQNLNCFPGSIGGGGCGLSMARKWLI